jgi:hypothetical protein
MQCKGASHRIASQHWHSLQLMNMKVRDVSALASCLSLSELWGAKGAVGDTDILGMIQDRRGQ